MKTGSLKLSLRVLFDAEIALGPGKVALLDAIEEQGTLTLAAQALGMSYMRAWKLLQTMNACFREPLVETSRGGTRHGGASLTPAGIEVRALYRAMEAASLEAAQPGWESLRGHLGPALVPALAPPSETDEST